VGLRPDGGATDSSTYFKRIRGQICGEDNNIRMRIVGPKSWSQQMKDATLEELADFPWISVPEACAFHRQRQLLFAGLGRQPKDCCHADSERAMLGLVTEGLGLCLMREEIAQSGQRDGGMVTWNGPVSDLHLRFVIPTIRRDEPIGRALMDATVRSWGHRAGAT
jgi:DNA-binding transcriptional LysR family regulator